MPKAKRNPQAASAESGESTNSAAAWPFGASAHTDVEQLQAGQDEGTGPDGVEIPPVEGERIQAESLDLYTDPAKNAVLRVDVQQLFESPFNPRKRYDQKALEELAETIRGVGVMQPILARPIDPQSIPMPPALVDGVLTDPQWPAVAYEVVFGHRRLRGAKLAGETDVPAIIRELTDAQSAQLQAIENVQREDLDAIDEAEGYAHYLKVHGITKDQLAQEIGLSRSHVYSRLKLLNGVPAVREACKAGEIDAEVALLLARIHAPKLQEKALASIKSNHIDLEDGGKRSYRKIREFLKEKFTLKLSEAIFDTKDAHLVALAGACTDCPKRSGNAPEYQDITEQHETSWGGDQAGLPNQCTDPDCFEAKKKQHLRNKAQAMQDRGKTVIEGGKARAAISAYGEVKGAYIALKDVKALLAAKKGNTVKAADLPSVVIQNPRDGKTVDAVRIEDLPATVKPKQATGTAGNTSAADAKRVAEHERAANKRKFECRVNKALLAEVRQAAAGQPLTALALRLAVLVAFGGVDWQDRDLLAELHSFKHADDLGDAIEKMAPDRLATLLLDCALVENVGSGYEKPEPLLAMAKELGIDIAAIRKTVAKAEPDDKTKDLLEEEQAEEEAATEA